MGSDVGKSKIPLIKTMQTGNEKLTIPGSSLKGVVRSIYEAITNSTLAVVTRKYENKMPRNRLPCRSKDKLCPASRVFGALDWLRKFKELNQWAIAIAIRTQKSPI